MNEQDDRTVTEDVIRELAEDDAWADGARNLGIDVPARLVTWADEPKYAGGEVQRARRRVSMRRTIRRMRREQARGGGQ